MSRKMPGHLRRQLTSVGRTTLVTETDTNRSIVACCLLFDGVLKKQAVIDRFNKELLKFDRFQSIVVDNQSYFEIIPDFDCGELFSEKEITKKDLRNDISFENTINCIEELLSSFANVPFKMNATKPMWRVHLFQFTDCKYTAMIFRMHHCICDGITLGTVFNRITDEFQNANQTKKIDSNATTTTTTTTETANATDKNISNTKPIAKKSVKKTKKEKAIVEKVVESILYFVFFWIFGLLACLWKLTLFTLQPEPGSMLKPEKLSERKHVAFISSKVSLSKVNAQRGVIAVDKKYMKSKLKKATFNDFIIAVIAQSMSLFLKKKNMPAPKFVRLGIPVNIRAESESHGEDTILGNKIGSYVIKSPISHSMTFIDKLIIIKKELDWVKKTPESKFSHYATRLVSNLPQSISSPLASYMSGKNTVVVSNVRGPDKPLTLFEKKCIVLAAPVPPPMGVALGFAVFSYQRDVMISVNVDDCVAGHDGAILFKQCILDVLKEQNCVSP